VRISASPDVSPLETGYTMGTNIRATTVPSKSQLAAKSVSRRPAAHEDEEFLRRVYASTRTDEMALVDWTGEQKTAFLDMQFHAQHTFYHSEWPDAEYTILEEDGASIGRIYIDRRDREIHVIDIALLPECRNRGLGTSLISEIMEEAGRTERSVTLYVETFNPAQRLYNRLGFVQVKTDGLYMLFEWRSPDHAHC